MNALPPELMTHILSYVDGELIYPGRLWRTRLSAYSSISRRWQQAIECMSLRRLYVRRSSLETLRNLYRVGHEHRLACTVSIDFICQLPCAPYKTDDDETRRQSALANNSVFQSSVLELLEVLSDVAKLDGPGRREGIMLEIGHTWSPEDRRADGFSNGYWRRWRPDAYLRIEDGVALPRSSFVSKVRIACDGPLVVDAASALAISSAFPLCKTVTIETDDKEYWKLNVRIEERHRLAQALNRTQSPSVTFLWLDFDRWSQRNEYNVPPSLVNGDEEDSLNLALHEFSQRSGITDVRLQMCFILSPAFFWPTSASTTPPLWPTLTNLYIDLDATTPDGKWYFINDPDPRTRFPEIEGEVFGINDISDADTDCDGACGRRVRKKGNVMRRFRTLPNPDTVEPLLVAMAKAARRMPAIKTMEVTRRHHIERLMDVLARTKAVRQFGVRYQVEDAQKLLHLVLGAWTPGEHVMSEWRKTVGEQGKIEFWRGKIHEDHFND